MPSFKMWILQDGADFFVSRTKEPFESIPALHRTAPFPVKDGDIEAAEAARRWMQSLLSMRQQFDFVES